MCGGLVRAITGLKTHTAISSAPAKSCTQYRNGLRKPPASPSSNDHHASAWKEGGGGTMTVWLAEPESLTYFHVCMLVVLTIRCRQSALLPLGDGVFSPHAMGGAALHCPEVALQKPVDVRVHVCGSGSSGGSSVRDFVKG